MILTGYRVSVYRQRCIACRVASDLCPDVFVLGVDTGKNRVVAAYSRETTVDVSAGVIPDDLAACVRRAAAACPVQAITADRL